MEKCMATTLLELPGYRIVKTLGIARGISFRTNEFGERFAATFKALAGGKVEEFVAVTNQMCEETCDEMLKNAENMGANAVIGFHYDLSQANAAWAMMILAYGTAAVVEKI